MICVQVFTDEISPNGQFGSPGHGEVN